MLIWGATGRKPSYGRVIMQAKESKKTSVTGLGLVFGVAIGAGLASSLGTWLSALALVPSLIVIKIRIHNQFVSSKKPGTSH